MEDYVAARSDIFFVGPDGSMRSNRAFSQTAGHYAIDMFIGGTLQIDPYGNSSTATANRVAGFGGFRQSVRLAVFRFGSNVYRSYNQSRAVVFARI